MKPSRRKSTDTTVGSIIHNHSEYPKDKKGIYLSHKPQRAGLIAKETTIKIPIKYVNFAFSPDLAFKLSKYTGINNHIIELVNVNGFIKSSKSSTGALR